ncbi:DNA topoisomerase 3 [Zophobihabitans entericus]|uniref:DNA topoisomerase n=1 Tax=Zophobihabitans entericus TaxID=1635327 RepID=A0A6G9IFB8_9GAMM|nr:DNA topoisomerase 3 [Zophobihabitans entericus]QIQ22527.1 DNA topoisomerase 3 [Zophobihabitans entericus]
MRLFIAEKPSVAKAIAEVLGSTDKGNGYIVCGDDYVTWCFGHLLESAEPDHYLSDDVPKNENGKKKWREQDLPIVPDKWVKQPREDAKEQLANIGRLIKKASVIVNAGDPDREGQLLVDEVLDHFSNTSPVLRYWTNAADRTSVERELSALRNNADYISHGRAAAARDKADWLIGMNLSRAYTLKAIRGGSRTLLTVGRVQTPTLAMVVKRDRDIGSFKSIPHYSIGVTIKHEQGEFLANWKMKDEQPGQDEEGRLIDVSKVEDVIQQISNQSGTITVFDKTPKKKYHPKVYSLSDLILVASNKFGYKGEDVLNTCQSLYERHKLTSYPRTDNGYLPESQFSDAGTILAILKSINPSYSALIDKADIKIKSKTWDDEKTTAHHGIVPTLHKGDPTKLSEMEKNIYDLIIKSYIAQFYPVHEFLRTTVEVGIVDETFVAAGNIVTLNGWKDVYLNDQDLSAEDDDKEEQQFPLMKKGDSVTCIAPVKKSLKTKPPSSFTDGSLNNAMSNIYRFIEDPEHKKILKEEDGLGTEATRTTIVSELVRRGFLTYDGKKIISTKLGRELVDALPESVKSPVLTAIYERMLKGIAAGTFTEEEFLAKQVQYITDQVNKANEGSIKVGHIPKVSNLHKCDLCGKGLYKLAGKKPGSFWWQCSGAPECTQTYSDLNGRPRRK